MDPLAPTITIHHVTNPRWKEAPMYGQDLLARERQTSLEREARRQWFQHTLVAAARSERRTERSTLMRRARTRLGDALIVTGQAISGATEDGARPDRVGRPA